MNNKEVNGETLDQNDCGSSDCYTPGPWINCNSHVDDSNGVTLFRSTRSFDDLNTLDFRLAATAPELLEACIQAEQVLRIGYPGNAAYLREVIAKATGG